MARPTIIYVNLRRPPLEVREALLAARRLDCDVALLADKIPDYVRPYVAAVEGVDTYDVERAVEAAQALAARLPVRGVVTWGDRDVELVARIGEVLGLPAVSPAAARRARNKAEMKRALAPLGGLVSRHALVRTIDDLHAALPSMRLPAVLKPVGASGSKGVFDVTTAADAEQAFHELKRITKPSFDPIFRQYGADLILEEFVAGRNVAVCGWVFDGDVTVVSIGDIETTDAWHLDIRGIHPSSIDRAGQALIAERTSQAASALGIDYCAFQVDGVFDGNDFRLIEMGARISGDYHASHLVPLATGVDFYAQVLRIALGERPSAQSQRAVTNAGNQFLLAAREGVFQGIAGMEEVLALPQMDRVSFETPIGSTIRHPPRSFNEFRVAAVLASDPDRRSLVRALDNAVERSQVLVASGTASDGRTSLPEMVPTSER